MSGARTPTDIRPIIFSAPMIRALRADLKTQTRRIVTPFDDASPATGLSRPVHSPWLGEDGIWRWQRGAPKTANFRADERRCPYGAVGDFLWVKETWTSLGYGPGFGAELHYAADGHDFRVWEEREKHRRIVDPVPDRDNKYRPLDWGPWRSPRFMPRWASRLTLEITDLRPERLHAITDGDARAEGIHEFKLPNGSIFGPQGVNGSDVGATAVEAYAALWDSLNGKRAPWSTNPWCWVIGFRRVKEESHGERSQ
jgi:hypothetical protein